MQDKIKTVTLDISLKDIHTQKLRLSYILLGVTGMTIPKDEFESLKDTLIFLDKIEKSANHLMNKS